MLPFLVNFPPFSTKFNEIRKNNEWTESKMQLYDNEVKLLVTKSR